MKNIIYFFTTTLLFAGIGTLYWIHGDEATQVIVENAPLQKPCAFVNQEAEGIDVLCHENGMLIRYDTNLKMMQKHKVGEKPTAALKLNADDFLIVGGAGEGYLYLYHKHQRTYADTSLHSPSAITRVGADHFAVADRYKNCVYMYKLEQNQFQRVATYNVIREPLGLSALKDGSKLLVSNAIPNEPSNTNTTTSSVTIIYPRTHEIKHIRLPATSFNLRAIQVSPDEKYAVVPHNLGRTRPPILRISRGWIVSNTISIIDLEKDTFFASVGLDDERLGAPNPYAVAFSPDGKTLAVSISGNHEIITLQFDAIIAKVKQRMEELKDPDNLWAVLPEDDYSFAHSLRQRIPLGLNGPRAIMFNSQNELYVAGYFSNNLCKMTLTPSPKIITMTAPTPIQTMSAANKGEMYFNDATKCNGRWFSCVTCHPEGRMDGVGWDLLNDGAGNPKNTRSMLFCVQTPPCMALGVRDVARDAIRAGFKSIQYYTLSPEDELEILPAIEAYFNSLTPIPSPYLLNGKLSPAAQRGKVLFEKSKCIQCHHGEYMTNNGMYDVGTTKGVDVPLPVNTPSLRELYLSSPYLHTGVSSSLIDVITTHNPKMRGNTQNLTPKELKDLETYLLSL